MALPELKRKYQMADANLIQVADAIDGSMERDAADFLGKRNVNPARRATLMAARDAFSDFPTDEELQGAVTVAAEAKAAMRGDMEKAIRAIRNIADTRYGGSGHYKTFAFDGMTNVDDAGLIRMAKRVVRVSGSLLGDLSTDGLTPGQVGALATLATAYDEAVDAVHDTEETRDIKTQQPVTLGNALYDRVVEFANIGKAIYEDTDEAKYNDYVITDSPPPPPPMPPDFPGS